MSSYNGNISSMTWQAGGEGTTRGYKFTYDGLNRFSENVTGYDKNGNIKTLQRYGQTSSSGYGLIDNLTYTLSGNQLTRVDDAVTASAYNNGFEFKNGASAANEYTYDANGNLTKDSNKGITLIQYNVLNLPSSITFSDGSVITYTYGADGTKLRTVHKIGSTTTITDYCSNVIYENNTAKLLLTEEGYVSLNDNKYHYYLKDHQGNNRVVINQSGSVEETNHYYPFGGVFAGTNSVQPYKYNGKEYDGRKGLNWYDYGARHYDGVLGRWHMVDPKVEKSYFCSPYTYCLNSPIRHFDPDGNQVVPVPLPLPVPMPISYMPYKPLNTYPTNHDVVNVVNNALQGMKDNALLFGGTTVLLYEQVKQSLSPEYKHQRNRDRRNKEGLDQNQANVAESIKNNITATTPSGDPMPKRDPEDGDKKTKIALSVATVGAGARVGLELTNPDPSKDAVEAHTEKVQQQTVEKQTNIWEIIKNWFQN